MRFLLILLLFSHKLSAQCPLRISLLTCEPGSELYSIFGHTAIRVTDSSSGTDIVYNYGTFSFDDDFYIKFVRGKLLYYLSVEQFREFVYSYEAEGRSVVEQVVNLDCYRLQQLNRSLQVNAIEKNRYYKYDFLFDNCTTRARDMIAAAGKKPVQYQNVIGKEAPSFRNLIHEYLDRGDQPWSKLGIDFLLGAKLDRKATNLEAMFLPEKLMQGMTLARTNDQVLTTAPLPLVTIPPVDQAKGWFTPFVFFSILCGLYAVVTLRRKSGLVRGMDRTLFFLSGVAGVLLLFMWFLTDHPICANNYNLLWANPLLLPAAFLLKKESGKIRTYFRFLFAILALAILGWAFLPQNMNEGFLPLLILLAYRLAGYAKIFGNGRKNGEAIGRRNLSAEVG